MELHQPIDPTPFVLSFGRAPSIECLGCGKVRELPHRRGFVEPGDISGVEDAHECGPTDSAWDQAALTSYPVSASSVSPN